MAEQTISPPRPTTNQITARTKPGQSTIWLEVTYDATHPPVELFHDLAALGYAVPPTAAFDVAPTGLPEVIEDGTDDPRGDDPGGDGAPQRLELTIVPPTGSGTDGGWTVEERAARERGLSEVLGRHELGALQLSVQIELDPAPGPPGGETRVIPAKPTRVTKSARRVARTRTGGAPVPVPVTTRRDAIRTARSNIHRVSIVARGHSLSEASRLVHQAGMRSTLTSHKEVDADQVVLSHRVVTVIVARLEVICDDKDLARLRPLLEAAGLEPQWFTMAVTKARPSDVGELVGPAGSAEPDQHQGRPV